jgi:hypothetical protein
VLGYEYTCHQRSASARPISASYWLVSKWRSIGGRGGGPHSHGTSQSDHCTISPNRCTTTVMKPQQPPVHSGSPSSARRASLVARRGLGWPLATCQQAHIDLWLTSEDHQGPYSAQPFVAWAVRSKNASQISIPTRPRRAFHRPLDADARWDIARQLRNDDSIETKDRVAGLMVLLYGQTPARTCRLTTEHVTQDENGVSLQLYKIPLRVPPPLDDLILQLVENANHQHTATSNELNAPWLFPTQRPGQHLTSKRLNARLRRIGLPPESGRCAALLDICTTMPPAILERLLGVSAPAAERWSAGAVRNAYAAEVAGRSSPR